MSVDVLDAFSLFLSHEKRLSRHTEDAYRRDLMAWQDLGLEVLGSTLPSQHEIEESVAKAQQNEQWAAATLSRRVSGLRSFVRFRALLDSRWEQVLELLPKSKHELPLPKALRVDEVAVLLSFSGEDSENQRNKACLELLYSSGMRVSELISLRWQDFDFSESWCRVQGKGGRERVACFSERTGEALERYRRGAWAGWAQAAPAAFKDHVFLSRRLRPLTRMAVWKILARRGLECGLDHLHPHVLRHSFATHLLQGGADVRHVQALLGHQSINTTERYLKLEASDLRKLFAEYHPLR